MTSLPSASRRLAAALLLATLALPMTACMTAGPARDVDAKFAAGWRPGKGYCAFGAESPALAAYCAEVNFGGDGLEVIARAANEKVLASAGGERLACTDHVARVRAELAQYPGYKTEELYSCDANPPVENGRAVCHVSLMVTSAAGARVVLDNGHVLDPGLTGGVASYTQFASLVDHHWTGEQPAWVAFASH
jgi:hypothetical protein